MEPTKKTINDYPIISNLIEKYFGDSKSESEKAEKELINICEPIIKKYCEAIEKYIEQIGADFSLRDDYFNFDYSCSRGDIDDFVQYDEEIGALEFWYSDGCRGEIYECGVYMPYEWLDEDKFDDNMAAIKKDIDNKYTRILKDKIAECIKDIDKLRKQLGMIEETA